MTREKAIEMLEYIRRTGNGESEYKNCAQSVALDMAIKALEQESILDKIRAEIDSAKMPKNRMSFFRDGIDCALQVIDKYIEQEPKTGWIPCSERLPKENGRYLVTLEYSTHNQTDVAGFSDNLCDVDNYVFQNEKRAGWYDYDSEFGYYEIDTVIAWQPLPKSYKGSENE